MIVPPIRLPESPHFTYLRPNLFDFNQTTTPFLTTSISSRSGSLYLAKDRKIPKPLNVSHSQGERSTELSAHLIQLMLTVILGSFACVALLLLLTTRAQSVQAAPPARPLAAIITDTVKVTHTPSTTHQMSVFGNGRITDQFLNDNGTDQIDDAPDSTTIAVLFDQHASTTNIVDVGVQVEFTPTTLITLNTASDIPGYSEDSYVVYASGVLSYQITQRTLATDTNNCVIMELAIRNTGSITTLTGGKLLYMMDINVGSLRVDDKGFYDPTRRLVYLTDYKPNEQRAYAMGISLLEGDWRGYGIVTDNRLDFPDPSDDAEIRDELITPTNTIIDGPNDVIWLVANIPDLDPVEATKLSFGLCARTAEGKGEETQLEAAANMKDSFDQLANLSVSKTATPTAGSSVVAGKPITYSIIISNTGCRYVNNIVVTDTLPASTDLITYSVSQGSITASNRLITATIGRLDPTSGTVTVTLVVAPSITSTNGVIISNQAFIKSEPIITRTNIITHQIINAPVLTVTKRADPKPVVSAGEVLTYTIVISSGDQGWAAGVLVSDTLPANTEFITGSIALDPTGAGTAGTAPPILASDVTIAPRQSVTVTFAVTVTEPLTDGTIITNTVSVTSTQVPTPTTSTITTTVITPPAVDIVKSGPDRANVGDAVVFTLTVTNAGQTLLQNVVVEDDYAGTANYVSGDNGDGWLDFTEAWVYTASYTIPPTTTNPLTNTATVTATDVLGAAEATATDTHTINIEFAPALNIFKEGPTTAKVGDTAAFTFTVANVVFTPTSDKANSKGDGSPISTVTVTDTIANPVNYVDGDDGDGLLEVGEAWIYTASYTIQVTHPDPLVNIGTATGQDRNGDSVSGTDTHSTAIEGGPNFFLPIILKNY
jgi:uncharacterized repeat protein (TIGR01451 family)